MKKHMFLLGLLLIWFTFDMFGFSIGNFVLVEAAWNSIDGIWWLIFVLLIILYVKKKWLSPLIIFLLMWLFIQYMSHWHYTIFGASPEKIKSYNQFFEKTYHLIPASQTQVIPDFYHIILHLLILLNFFVLIDQLFRNKIKKD